MTRYEELAPTVQELKRQGKNEEALPDSAWSNAEPGQFIVIYKVFDEGVPRVIVGTGNNP